MVSFCLREQLRDIPDDAGHLIGEGAALEGGIEESERLLVLAEVVLELLEAVLQSLPVLKEGVEAGHPLVGAGKLRVAPVVQRSECERKKRPETAAVWRRTRDEYKKKDYALDILIQVHTQTRKRTVAGEYKTALWKIGVLS